MQKEELYISYITKEVAISGTTTSDNDFKLIDAGALFLTGATPISKGDLATNTATQQTARVIKANTDTEITLDKDIFPVGSSPTAYKINKQINERIELLESLNPNITFNISDIAKPDERKSDYSKTIRLPGSKRLRKVFENIFEVNIDLNTFNPNLKTDVLYLVDGEINLDGYLQLKQVNIIDNDDVVFECTIIGRIGDFVKALGDKELINVDLSSLNHTYNRSSQSATWGTPLPLDYVYPMIDYGTHYDWSNWEITDFFPAVKVKKYLDDMFTDAGYTYSSTFLQSPFFNTLIIPFSAEDFKLNDTEVNNRIFKANTPDWDNGTTDFVINPSSLAVYLNPQTEQIRFSNEVYDVGNVYDDNAVSPTYGTYTVNANGYYNINLDISLNVEFAPTGATTEDTQPECGLTGALEIRKNNTVIEQKNVAIVYDYIQNGDIPASGVGLTAASPTYPDRDYKASGSQAITTVGIAGAFTNNNNRFVNPPNRYILQSSAVYLEAGDEITITGSFFFAPLNPTNAITELFKGVSTGNYYTGVATVKLINGTFFNQVANTGYVEGNTIDMNNATPKDIKQKDFFMSIVKMFNLYVQTDTANDKNVFIEPRDDFYNNTTQDWSQKLDISQQLEYLPMGSLDSKEYLFTYKQDKDYYNELYETTWNEVYGEYEKKVENDFINNKYKTELIFSPTPSKGIIDNDRIIPSIVKTDNNNQAQRTQSNIRILQWGGMLTTAQGWQHIDSTGSTDYFTYPYAGHYDEPYTPTIDINFGLTKEIYWDDTYSTITWTNNNLYNKYYKKFIEEITDVNSKIVKGWFYLRPSDIRNLSFREQYYFDGAYFRLNKIENYNPSNPITKCEFLKLKEVDPFVPETTTATGGIEFLAGNQTPVFISANNLQRQGNNYTNRNQQVNGENNYISYNARFVDINGNDNNVFSEAENITIQGDGNTILAGLSNIQLINTNNVTVNESNVTYINGELRGAGSVEEISTSTTAIERVQTYIADTSAANIVINLPSDPTIGKIWNFKKIVAPRTLQLRATPKTIDGNATLNINQKDASYTIQYDGNNYIII